MYNLLSETVNASSANRNKNKSAPRIAHCLWTGNIYDQIKDVFTAVKCIRNSFPNVANFTGRTSRSNSAIKTEL